MRVPCQGGVKLPDKCAAGRGVKVGEEERSESGLRRLCFLHIVFHGPEEYLAAGGTEDRNLRILWA